jgi:fermentation-respiration switch protein FrsA (DUF1100 family)
VRVAVALAVVLATSVALLWAAQRRLLYLPSGPVATPIQAGIPSAEVLAVPTEDGLTLAAWLVPAAAERPRATVIVFNGNAGNRSFRATLARRLVDAGCQVCLFDYRGYGGNAGSPSESGLLADGRAVAAAVGARTGVDRHRIVYLGESLGTGVAVALAVETPPLAVILRSPFTSITDVAAHHYWFLPVRALLWDRFDSGARIGSLRCPVAMVAGDRDRVVPISFSRRLFDMAPGSKSFVTVPGADHNDADLAAGAALIDALTWALEQGPR